MEHGLELTLRLGLAALAGVVLGANRSLHHKSAGVKTHALVSIGAAVALLIFMPLEPAAVMDQKVATDAASRVLQGLITGIGFLGAGVIIHNARDKRIQGLTTAASIWITTLMGAAMGAGHFVLGTLAVLMTGLVLLVGNDIERWVEIKFGETTTPPSKEQNQP
jgi:putative Mg2+ transporter-C (MgtC) family protein